MPPVEPISRKDKVKTALILLSVAAAFLIGFIIRHWQ
jgi:hypothetical protein